LGRTSSAPSLAFINHPSRAYQVQMTDRPTPFADFDLERAIALRWTLRDIKARRFKLAPVSETDLQTLRELGLVELQDDVPVLTPAGHEVLE
jgi:hypothetical protein